MDKIDLVYGVFLLALIICFSIVFWVKYYDKSNQDGDK